MFWIDKNIQRNAKIQLDDNNFYKKLYHNPIEISPKNYVIVLIKLILEMLHDKFLIKRKYSFLGEYLNNPQ